VEWGLNDEVHLFRSRLGLQLRGSVAIFFSRKLGAYLTSHNTSGGTIIIVLMVLEFATTDRCNML